MILANVDQKFLPPQNRIIGSVFETYNLIFPSTDDPFKAQVFLPRYTLGSPKIEETKGEKTVCELLTDEDIHGARNPLERQANSSSLHVIKMTLFFHLDHFGKKISMYAVIAKKSSMMTIGQQHDWAGLFGEVKKIQQHKAKRFSRKKNSSENFMELLQNDNLVKSKTKSGLA